ncbi:MAG: hypothetical protein GC154_09445 [bacterium]|nr:hypothetical protein [bacterium]
MEIREQLHAFSSILTLLVLIGIAFLVTNALRQSNADMFDAQQLDAPTARYEYDASDRLSAIHYSDGEHVYFQYNKAGRLIGRSEKREPGEAGNESDALVIAVGEGV